MYGNFGIVINSFYDFEIVLDYFNLLFEIFKEIGNKIGEGNLYCYFGNIF